MYWVCITTDCILVLTDYSIFVHGKVCNPSKNQDFQKKRCLVSWDDISGDLLLWQCTIDVSIGIPFRRDLIFAGIPTLCPHRNLTSFD